MYVRAFSLLPDASCNWVCERHVYGLIMELSRDSLLDLNAFITPQQHFKRSVGFAPNKPFCAHLPAPC